MNRLTKRGRKGRAYFDDDGALILGANGTFHQKKDMTAHYIHQRFVALDKTIDRLAAYEDTGLTPEDIVKLKSIEIWADAVENELYKYIQAEKEGRLAVVPCKVGDIVYDIQDGTPYATKVLSFSYFGDHWACRTISSYPDLGWFGTRIFLTLDEAEAALAKQKEERN